MYDLEWCHGCLDMFEAGKIMKQRMKTDRHTPEDKFGVLWLVETCTVHVFFMFVCLLSPSVLRHINI